MAAFSTTDNKLYLVNVDKPTERVYIQFFPRELPFERTIKSNDIDIIGRNNPLEHYTGGATTFRLELDFYAEEDNLQDVMRRIKLIESWTYNEGYSAGRNEIKVVCGYLFKAQEVWLNKKCSYRLTQFQKNQNALPQQAYMDLTLSLSTKGNTKASDIKNIW